MTTEFDELKQSWREFEQRVQTHLTAQVQAGKQPWQVQQILQARRSLSPLFWGHLALIAAGIACIYLGVSYWSSNWQYGHRLVCGILVHVYGVSVIVCAGITLGKLNGINFADSLSVVQKKMRSLRRWYIVSGAVMGLPWWLLWLPFMQILFSYGGVDFLGNASLLFLGLNFVVGIVGLLGTWSFHRWLHQPGREAWAQRFDDEAAGDSIRKAEQILSLSESEGMEGP